MTRSKSGRPPRLFWTPEEDQQLCQIYPDATAAECARQIGRTKASVFQRARLLGLAKSAEFFESDRSGRVTRGKQNPAMAATRFQKGIVPWNKGTKGVAGQHPNCKAAQFKKGDKRGKAAKIELPIGADVVREEILYRKVNNDLPIHHRFRSVHGLVWEAAHGPIPSGHKVVFRPGLHPHRLRASFATTHFEAGTPLSQIQQMMGHEDPETTMRYIVQRPKDQAVAQERVSELMGFKSPFSPAPADMMIPSPETTNKAS